MEGIDDFNEENIDEFFQKTETEISDEEKAQEKLSQIREYIHSWVEEEKPRIKERLKYFGIEDESVTDEMMERLSTDFLRDLRNAFAEYQEKKGGLIKIKEQFGDRDQYKSFLEPFDSITHGELMELLYRKFTNNLSVDDRMMLTLMDQVIHEGTGATHDSLSGTINLNIFNTQDLNGYTDYLDHELTHFGLNEAVPQAGGLALEAQAEVNKDKTKINPKFHFALILAVFNESAAHIAGGNIPRYEAYARNMRSQDLQAMHTILGKAVEGMTEEERDTFFVEKYKELVGIWRDDMTLQDVKKIEKGFLDELSGS